MTSKITYHNIKLKLTSLHYMKAGSGPPLIMVPATISEINNWTSLVQYMAQKFTVYFFELPGHGKSTAFKKKFKSDYVAQTIEEFIDKLGYKKVSLMGFSFGGILTMKILNRIRDSINKVVLFAPCVTYKALTHSKSNIIFLKNLLKVMKSKLSQKIVLRIIHNKSTVNTFIWFLRNFGKVEALNDLRYKLLNLKASTLDVLIYQLNEIFTTDFKYAPFANKLYFGMSIHDPLLDFEITKKTLKRMFNNINIQEFNFPYHQPPEPFTFEELNEKFEGLVDKIAE